MIQNRKLEHLNICNEKDVAYKKSTGFENIEFVHRALCEVNKSDINISTYVFSKKLDSPLFISAITGGHPFAEKINKELLQKNLILDLVLVVKGQVLNILN